MKNSMHEEGGKTGVKKAKRKAKRLGRLGTLDMYSERHIDEEGKAGDERHHGGGQEAGVT